MFDFVGRRVLPVVLSFALVISLCVPFVSAAGLGCTDGLDIDSVDGWTNSIRNPITEFVEEAANAFNLPFTGSAVFWYMVDGAHDVQPYELGEITDKQLNAICARFNTYFNTPLEENPKIFTWLFEEFITRTGSNALALALGLGTPLNFVLKKHPSSGLWRIFEETNGLWVVNSAGQYFCYDESTSGDTWIHVTEATNSLFSSRVAMETGPDLKFKYDSLRLNGDPVGLGTLQGRNSVQYKAIRKGNLVRADYRGYPYVSPSDDSYWLIYDDDRGQDTDVKDENGDPVEGLPDENITNINLGDMTINLPDGILAYIESLTYDEGEKTYYIDAIYKDVTNNYTTNYYFKWEYHINYTSITYIGQTEQYDKYYEVYYELPDGRSSADLTKEELEQLNVSMDVIPYGRSADDTSLRSLYHFDGDTRDASYWNYCTNFDWTQGASLTYMDAGVFKGALYLDEGKHQFSVTLPSPIYTDNFTIQFRYYQSATPAPVTDSGLRLASSGSGAGRFDWLLAFDGASMYDMNGEVLSRIPTGTWNEIAITRYRYATYYYLNGVCVGEVVDRSSFGGTLFFTFGDGQQTYKYFDELRVLNHALKDDGSDYTPTSVPHDTNLSLVLPTDAVPLADEYWSFNAERNLLGHYDYSVFAVNEEWLSVSNGMYNNKVQDVWRSLSDTYVSAVAENGYTSFINSGDSNDWSYLNSTSSMYAFCLPLYVYANDKKIVWQGLSTHEFVEGNTYTFSFMTHSGDLYSYTFTLPATRPSRPTHLGRVSFENGVNVGLVASAGSATSDANCVSLLFSPPKNGQVDVVYMELVEGTEPNTGHEWVESVTVIDKDDINKATLAVRTDIPITKHYIGGVRPSVPQKGYVWALVENQRIKSLQIYNGQAWEAVDGRIWTGERWVPYSSYNIITMQDLFDVQDATQDFEYIYTEQGFWDWWQKSWNAFTEKLFSILQSADCNHIYDITGETAATCTDPGETVYTCSVCNHTYKDIAPALGHDWLVTEEVSPRYELPADISCPDCHSSDFSAVLDKDSQTYSCTCNNCSAAWVVQAIYTDGYSLYTCSRCEETTTELDDDRDLFESIGGLIADGITWATDKMAELVQSISGITKIFDDFVVSIKENTSEYPALLAAVIAIMPEDLMLVFWFGVVLFVVMAVWKKWFH